MGDPHTGAFTWSEPPCDGRVAAARALASAAARTLVDMGVAPGQQDIASDMSDGSDGSEFSDSVDSMGEQQPRRWDEFVGACNLMPQVQPCLPSAASTQPQRRPNQPAAATPAAVGGGGSGGGSATVDTAANAASGSAGGFVAFTAATTTPVGTAAAPGGQTPALPVMARRKRGRPVGSKDTAPRKQRTGSRAGGQARKSEPQNLAAGRGTGKRNHAAVLVRAESLDSRCNLCVVGCCHEVVCA